MRPRVLAFTIATALTLAAAGGLAAGSWSKTAQSGPSAEPRHLLAGDWRLARGVTFRFTVRGGKAEGRAARNLRAGRCSVRRGSVMFRDFRFTGTRGGRDVWKGRAATIGRDCRRTFASSTIAVLDHTRFKERTRTFRRIRPKVTASDPIVGTWVRNNAGIVVTPAGRRYEGRAREAFVIPNGCTVAAGTVVWIVRPLVPGVYDGRIPTFLPPPGCEPSRSNPSRWALASPDRLLRRSAAGPEFEYARASTGP